MQIAYRRNPKSIRWRFIRCALLGLDHRLPCDLHDQKQKNVRERPVLFSKVPNVLKFSKNLKVPQVQEVLKVQRVIKVPRVVTM